MNFLYQSAFAEALGWSLIDSLWQMGAAWLIYITITGNGSKFSSQQRHSLALAGSAMGTLIFFVSLGFNYYNAANNTNFLSLAYFIEKQAGETFVNYPFAQQIVPFISFVYIPAVAFFLLRLIVNVSFNKNIYRKNLIQADDNICGFVRKMSERTGILKKVTVWMSQHVESPLTIGFWKPAIFLPVAVFNHLSYRQVEAVIMHELYHIKRNDYIINIFLSVAEVILFFNPFARMMFATVKKERENSCDDHVIASGFDAWEYSQALYILGMYRNEKNNLAIAATGEGKEYLLQRIRRIMKRNNPSPSVLRPFIAFFLCLFVAGFAARQKQIAAPPEDNSKVQLSTKTRAKPIVFYLEQKRITIIPTEKTTAQPNFILPEKKIKILAKPEKKDKINTLISPEPELTEAPLDEVSQDLEGTYVAAPKVLEFTIIDPATPVVPEIICETPQPFIQKSSFYFTEVDTTVGKKIIVL
jgi:beta-lactamase regulating signal transducer with metallopeptidase domain